MIRKLSPEFFGQPEMSAQDSFYSASSMVRLSATAFRWFAPTPLAELVALWIMKTAFEVVLRPWAPKKAIAAAEQTCPAVYKMTSTGSFFSAL